jgi:hypothetical protein
MTPKEIQNQINQLQAELDKLKQADTYFPELGEVVWVSDDLEEWHKRIFIKFLGFKSSPYKCVWENKSNTTKNYLLGKNYITSDWAYCRRMDGEIIPFGRDKYNTDYSHLLPDGYEFCKKEECDEETEIMYLKVKLHNLDPNEKPLGSIMQDVKHMEAFYTPIRQKVQYHVAVHEAVTTEPNPYSVDWSNAPIWADVHCFDEDGRGFWYGSECLTKVWVVETCPSKFTLPTGLDWKLSKTTRPK